MHTPWMFTAGCTMLGFVLPEILATAFNEKINMAMNIWCSLACGLVAASFVY